MKFSRTAFVLTFLLHVGGTVLLVLASFGTAMSSFNRPPAAVHAGLHSLDIFGWIWCPVPLLFEKVFHLSVGLLGYLGWSVIVGILAGYGIGYFLPKRQSPVA